MKNYLSKKSILFAAIIFSTYSAFAVDYSGKVTEAAGTFKTTAKTVSDALCVAFLAIGLITVVYNLASNKPNSKEFIMGWLAAVVISGLFSTFLS